jgi:adenine phosphoribosyltransferase
MNEVRAKIRDVPDFPTKGVVFKDITPVQGITKVVGVESRGFVFAAPLAYALDAGLVIVRKPGKLPWHRVREVYQLEYGEDALEMHVDALGAGDRAVIVDDVLATGGTADAVGRLVVGQGAALAGYSFLLELGFLHGARRIGADKVHALLHY